MHKIIVTLACLSCAGQARRTRASSPAAAQSAFIAPFRIRNPSTTSISQEGSPRAAVLLSTEPSEKNGAMDPSQEDKAWAEQEIAWMKESEKDSEDDLSLEDAANERNAKWSAEDEDLSLEDAAKERKGIFARTPTPEEQVKHMPWARKLLLEKEQQNKYQDLIAKEHMRVEMELDVPGRSFDWVTEDYNKTQYGEFGTPWFSPKEIAHHQDLPLQFVVDALERAGVEGERIRVDLPVRTFAEPEEQEAFIAEVVGVWGSGVGVDLQDETLWEIADDMEVTLDRLLCLCEDMDIPTALRGDTKVSKEDYGKIIRKLAEEDPDFSLPAYEEGFAYPPDQTLAEIEAAMREDGRIVELA